MIGRGGSPNYGGSGLCREERGGGGGAKNLIKIKYNIGIAHV